MELGKLQTWLQRERKGASRLRVLAMELGQQPVTTVEYSAGDMKEISDPAQLILDACLDYADSKGESVQFRIEWLRADGSVLGNCFHRQAPLEDQDGNPGGRNAIDADLSVNRIVAQFMRHDEIRERMLIGSLGTVFGSLETTIKLQGAIIDKQGQQLLLLHQQLQAIRSAAPGEDESTEEARMEAVARTGAWNKLAEIGPIALQAFLEHRAASASGARPNGSNGSPKAA